MPNLLDDFDYRKSLLVSVGLGEGEERLFGFLEWLISEPITNSIIEGIKSAVNIEDILGEWYKKRTVASSLEEIVAIGLFLMSQSNKEENLVTIAAQRGILSETCAIYPRDHFPDLMQRFIEPAIEYIRRELESQTMDYAKELIESSKHTLATEYPLAITKSLEKFFRDYPEYKRNAFIMMTFSETKPHELIIKAIESTLKKYGIHALRADSKQYHDDLLPNVLTYIYGCYFGIAVFERLEEDDFNPNVSFEVGYMHALDKSVCLLKDKTLATLQTDLVGKIYRPFDTHDAQGTIPLVIEAWLRDKDIIGMS